MWATISTSVTGTSHEATGVPCQDACHVSRVQIDNEEVMLAAIADGAGSASHSQIGSREAVQQLVDLVSKSDLSLAEINQAQVGNWYQSVQEHLRTVGERESVAFDELACTLLLAVAWKGGAVLAQIGDGAWVLEVDGALVAGTWPETGEYANVTVFLTTHGALEHLQFQRIEGKMNGVAGFTDGLQSLTLDYARRTPSQGFFNAMFGPLRTSTDVTKLVEPLQQLLASDLITSRTDDDKTLVLGVWREPENKVEPDGSTQ